MKTEYITAKTILNKSKLHGLDYTINPYIGCGFACKYCYASYLSNLVKEENSEWGNFVYIKKNTIELLDKSLKKFEHCLQTPSIMVSSATDPYQYIESKEKITRGIFEKFVEYDFKGQILCLTKSPLILRDMDLFKQLKNLTLNFSISNDNKKIKDYFEPNAPSIRSRFKALEILNKNNLNTCVFIAPILPYYENHIDELESLIKSIKNAGTTNIVYDLLNMHGNMNRYRECFKNSRKGRELYVEHSENSEYREKMKNIMKNLIQKYNLTTNYER